jgi:dTMP kinase
MTGKFIVFEGVEGSGKTTQIQQAAAWLQSLFGKTKSIVITREPGGTDLGRQIRQLLLEDADRVIGNRAELLLYAADRAQHIESIIEPQLAAGNIVLCDRFTDSTIAYQGYGRGFDLAEIDRINLMATGGRQSDLTFWLDLDVMIGLERVGSRGKPDRIECAAVDFHQRVRYGYQVLSDTYPDRITKINADQSISAIQTEIQTVLMQLEWQSDSNLID